jgi:MFS family permease
MPKFAWRPWVLVAAFSLVLFLITAATYNALGVVLPAMVKEQGWSWTEAGFGFTLLGAATGGSSFLPPILIRRFGVRATLLCGTAVMSGGFFCLARTHGVGLYFLGAALCGIGYQMMALIPGTHVLAAMFKHRALPFGVYFSSAAVGGVAGPFVVFGLLHIFHDQWRMFWTVQSVAALVVGLVCAIVVGGEAALVRASRETDLEVAAEVANPATSRVYRTPVDWTTRAALRTPQFYVLLAAYFAHLLIGVTVAADATAHLTQRGVSLVVAGTMLSFEALMQGAGRAAGGLVGDRIDPRYLLMFALASLMAGAAALSVASDYPLMLIYAIGSGLGFGLTLLTVTVLLLNYYGRRHNLEIFSIICLGGAVSALGPTIGGEMRDLTGSFTSTFQMFAAVVALIFIAVAFMRPPRRAASLAAAADAEAADLAVHFAQDSV